MDTATTMPLDDPRDRRPAATALLIGAVLLLVGNIAHPVDADLTATSRLELVTGAWLPVHLVIAAGMVALTTGFAQLADTARHHVGLAGALRTVAVVGGVAMVFVFAGLDGHAVAALAKLPPAGASADTVESAAIALTAADTGLSGVGTLCLLGIAFLLTGTLVLHERSVPTWLGAAALVVGVAGTVTGLTLLAQGATTATINLLLRPTAAGATVVTIGLGLSLLRRAARVAAPAATPPTEVGTRPPTLRR